MNGPKIIFKIPLFGGIPVTETIVNCWIVMAVVILVSIWLGSNLKIKPETKRQLVAEKLVGMLYNLVEGTMGKKFSSFAPYIGALFTMSITGSLSSLFGLRPYTADLSTTLAWAVLTSVMVWIFSIKASGVKGWLKGFAEPVPFILPINLIGEIANPISMSFRHFGNIAAGMVITNLVYGGLANLSQAVLSFIPNTFLNQIPIFQLGIPALLSIYFDLFGSFLQAYIICMLTMVNVSNTSSD